MDEWRERLRRVVAGWGLSPEEQTGIVDELEQHLEQELDELRPRIGEAAALERIMAQVNDPALRDASVQSLHRPAMSVQSSRSRARGLGALARDFQFGWRALRTSPGTTAMATIALALGIGLTTLMFTVIYSLLLRGLPFEKPERIAMVMEANPSQGEEELSLSMHDLFAYRDAQQSFEAFGGWSPTTVNIAGDERPERVDAARMTAAALSLTRVRPLLGRILRMEDEVPDGELVVLLSHSLWRDRYAADSSVIGRAVRVNGQPATVVGVMPEGFGFPHEAKLWLPLRLNPAAVPWGSGAHANGVARLRPGVTYAQANADLAAIAKRIASEHPESNKGVRAVVQPFIRATLPRRTNALLYTMFGAVALVLLVACTNVANLLVARAMHRSKEVAIRVALGASRTAIARQFLVEALVLSLVSAGLGALIAQGGLVAFRQATAGQTPFWADFRLHPQVFFFIAFTALLASVVSGLLPALTAARSDVTDVLKDKSMGSSSLRSGKLSRGLVVFELALSSTLLVVAALTTKSVLNLRSIEPGFRTRGVMTGQITLSIRDSARRVAFFEHVEDEIARLPGATATSLSSRLPGTGWSEGSIAVEGRTYARGRRFPSVRQLAASPGFFKTFDITMSRGRLIGREDRVGTLPVAVVNQRFVDRQFPGADPIGHRINLSPNDTTPQWVTIVGIVPNLYATDQGSINSGNPWPAEVITAFRQEARASASIAIRTEGDRAAVGLQLRTLIASLDPDLPVYSLASMTDLLARARWDVRVFGSLFIVFGIVALALAAIGLYAVLAFSVSRREREMGIRMALGAAAADVVRLVIRDGAVQLVIGVSVGLFLGVSVARLAGAVLFQVQPTDPMVLGVVAATLGLTGLAACVMPALRATRSDPVRSLRAE
ncbi:MAG TPA: ABC transporter permease [Gemmatimonadaceae bacterium]|nr:ABC transporter permease [Gemmatimonadaceae bacterium]